VGPVTLSDRLQALRRSRFWTQEQLQAVLARNGLSFSRTAISSWESRAITPSVETLRALARIYELPPAEEIELYHLAADNAGAQRQPHDSTPEQLVLPANEAPTGSGVA